MIFQLLEKVFLNPSTRFFSSDRSSLLPQFLRWCGDFYLLIQSSPGRSSAFTPSFHNFFETLHNIFLFLIEVHYCFSFYDFISKTKFSWQELCLSPPFHSPLGCNCRSHYRIPSSHDLQHSQYFQLAFQTWILQEQGVKLFRVTNIQKVAFVYSTSLCNISVIQFHLVGQLTSLCSNVGYIKDRHHICHLSKCNQLELWLWTTLPAFSNQIFP